MVEAFHRLAEQWHRRVNERHFGLDLPVIRTDKFHRLDTRLFEFLIYPDEYLLKAAIGAGREIVSQRLLADAQTAALFIKYLDGIPLLPIGTQPESHCVQILRFHPNHDFSGGNALTRCGIRWLNGIRAGFDGGESGVQIVFGHTEKRVQDYLLHAQLINGGETCDLLYWLK